jgi:hypothetical protein
MSNQLGLIFESEQPRAGLFSEAPRYGAPVPTPDYNAGRDIHPVRHVWEVLKGGLARVSRPFPADGTASSERTDGFKKPVRRKCQQNAIALIFECGAVLSHFPLAVVDKKSGEEPFIRFIMKNTHAVCRGGFSHGL